MHFLERDVENYNVSEGQVNQVLFRMTPIYTRRETDFQQTFQIRNEIFKNFDDLYEHREKIRHLILLPIKEQSKRAYYATLDKHRLSEELLLKMEDSTFMLSENDYPYEAPDDVQQYILWIKNKEESDITIAKFIAKTMKALKIDINAAILFERPINTSTPLVRGTFPLIRHMHLWVKKINNE